MLDYDLAELYEVPTKALNQAVKRNIQRFPSDFMFRLTLDEWDLMRSQNVTASRRKTIIKSDSETNKMFQVSSFSVHASILKRETLKF